MEEPVLLYEDGEKTIFLYTKGAEGKPSKELLSLAQCRVNNNQLEHFTIENARTVGLERLYEMVMEVKSEREVGLVYM